MADLLPKGHRVSDYHLEPRFQPAENFVQKYPILSEAVVGSLHKLPLLGLYSILLKCFACFCLVISSDELIITALAVYPSLEFDIPVGYLSVFDSTSSQFHWSLLSNLYLKRF